MSLSEPDYSNPHGVTPSLFAEGEIAHLNVGGASIARCGLCTPATVPAKWSGSDDGVFRVLWTEQGIEQMQQHMLEAHGRTPRPGLCGCVGGPRCCARRRNDTGTCAHIDCCVSAFPMEALG